MMESSISGESWISEMRSHSWTNWPMCSAVKASTAISATQVWSVRASWTVRFFLLEALKIRGAISFGGLPSSHEEDQKEAFLPSPIVTRVAALKSCLSEASLGVSKPTQGFSGAFHSSQSQRSLRARENLSKSRIPNPPSSLGRQTFCQLTFHFPPLTDSLQSHSIPRQILAIALRKPLSTLIAVRRKIGMEERTYFT